MANSSLRKQLLGHKVLVFWFTGLSGSGKTTLANRLEEYLLERKILAFVLDGDKVRDKLNHDLDFSEAGRTENIRRSAEVTRLFLDSGMIVLSSFITPTNSNRKLAKDICNPYPFYEILVNCPLEICETRDAKGLYKRARNNEILEFTGVSSPYELPKNPDLIISTGTQSLESSFQELRRFALNKLGLDEG